MLPPVYELLLPRSLWRRCVEGECVCVFSLSTHPFRQGEVAWGASDCALHYSLYSGLNCSKINAQRAFVRPKQKISYKRKKHCSWKIGMRLNWAQNRRVERERKNEREQERERVLPLYVDQLPEIDGVYSLVLICHTRAFTATIMGLSEQEYVGMWVNALLHVQKGER